MTTDEQERERKRVTGWFSRESVEALGNISLHVSTTCSRTITAVVEDWLIKKGLLDPSVRIYSKAEMMELEAAARSASASGPVTKLNP